LIIAVGDQCSKVFDQFVVQPLSWSKKMDQALLDRSSPADTCHLELQLIQQHIGNSLQMSSAWEIDDKSPTMCWACVHEKGTQRQEKEQPVHHDPPRPATRPKLEINCNKKQQKQTINHVLSSTCLGHGGQRVERQGDDGCKHSTTVLMIGSRRLPGVVFKAG
jgi:hypothetical protein